MDDPDPTATTRPQGAAHPGARLAASHANALGAAPDAACDLGRAPFLDPGCVLPLREGIAAHRARVPGLITADDDPSVGPLFEGHDACHVLFGCSTSPADEARVDTWTLLGTTMTVRRYVAYLTHPALAPIYEEFARWEMLRPALGSVVDVPRIWSRTRAMTRVWDFDGWAAWADVPICDIRAAHGIRLLEDRSASA